MIVVVLVVVILVLQFYEELVRRNANGVSAKCRVEERTLCSFCIVVLRNQLASSLKLCSLGLREHKEKTHLDGQ